MGDLLRPFHPQPSWHPVTTLELILKGLLAFLSSFVLRCCLLTDPTDQFTEMGSLAAQGLPTAASPLGLTSTASWLRPSHPQPFPNTLQKPSLLRSCCAALLAGTREAEGPCEDDQGCS